MYGDFCLGPTHWRNFGPHPLISARIVIGREHFAQTLIGRVLAPGLVFFNYIIRLDYVKGDPLCRQHGELQYFRLG